MSRAREAQRLEGGAAGRRHRVDLVRPGPSSLRWLRETVAAIKAGDPLAPVTVVVPSAYHHLVVRRALARDGCANLRTAVLREFAARLAESDGHGGALTGVLEMAAVRASLRAEPNGILGRVAEHPALHETLAGLFRELRHLADSDTALEAIASRGAVAAAAAMTFRRFRRLTDGYYDVPDLARRAAAAVDERTSRWADESGALVLYLPPRLDAAELDLLVRVGRHVPVAAAFACFDEPTADTLMEQTARALAAALGTGSPSAAHPPDRPPADTVLVSAPDPSEEVKAAVRGLAYDLETGVPLWRMALLYTDEETYGTPSREALDAAGLPWHGATGRPASAGWAARSLLALLTLRERRFARDAVLDWLSGRPPTAAGAADDPFAIPLSVWDRLSRRAQVHEGPRQWVERFRSLAASLEREEAQGADPGPGADERPPPAAPLPDSAYARAIATAIAELASATRPPDDGSTWDEFVAWATRLRERYVPTSDSWPEAERLASDVVSAALESLRTAAVFEPTTTLRSFKNALAAALASLRLPEGRAGVGVVVGTIGTVVGAEFDRVYVLGMNEGSIPRRPPPDPLGSSEGGPDPLGRRDRQREAERRALLGALAAADGGRVTLSYARSDGAARLTHPSRWFLDAVSRREGHPVYASDLPGLFGPGRPWLVRIASSFDGAARISPTADGRLSGWAPADLGDLRLASAVRWHSAGRGLARHPLALRADLPLGRALAAARARRSRSFTPYDGNLGELAGASRLMARAFGRGCTSATAVECWATCHFLYFLQYLLRVQATRRPEDEWTITPLDQGSLVHDILETFFRELHDGSRGAAGDRLTAADHQRLDQIAAAAFAKIEAEGRSGHPLSWENARAAILTDLHELIERDVAWRRAEGVQPALFERSFGDSRDPTSWPAATVTLPDGRRVEFRGLIDRVDLSDPGLVPRKALVIDYKTGSAEPYKEFNRDPLLGGRHVQLALYARALRAALEPTEGPIDVTAEFRFVGFRGEFRRLKVVADASLDRRLDSLVRWVADGVAAGIFLPVPGPPDQGSFANCRFCDYDRVCSVTRDEAWERKHGTLPEPEGA